jgi:cell division protein YceG involved in septum cleavage
MLSTFQGTSCIIDIVAVVSVLVLVLVLVLVVIMFAAVVVVAADDGGNISAVPVIAALTVNLPLGRSTLKIREQLYKGDKQTRNLFISSSTED